MKMADVECISKCPYYYYDQVVFGYILGMYAMRKNRVGCDPYYHKRK